MLTIKEMYDLSHSLAGEYLSGFAYAWEALEGISALIKKLGSELDPSEYDRLGEDIWIAKSAVVAPTALIAGPCILGPGTEVRHCAFIRGSALVGSGCVVGNSTELKNVILFDKVQVPHYNYVGDSILGYKAHMGAGSITSNVKSDKLPVLIRDGEQKLATNRKKVGAMIGDEAEIGCNAVLNPGTVIGRQAIVYPTSCVRGLVPQRHIHKVSGELVARE